LSDFTYNYSTQQGSEYVINFSVFDQKVLEENLVVYDLVLEKLTDKGSTNYELLNHLAKLVLEFLEDKDCIIYFYCDEAPIKKSVRNSNIPNKEFRSKLFKSIFERQKRKARINSESFDYIMRTNEIADSENGNHFISLISKTNRGEDLENLSSQILSLNDK